MEKINESSTLNEEEVEQAMIINKLDLDMIKKLMGIIEIGQNLSTSLLFLERLGHSNSTNNFLEEIAELGNNTGEKLLQILQSVICEEWNYCERKAVDGLGDPRKLIQALAPLIASRLNTEKATLRSRLIVSCVFVSRSGLSLLCQCHKRKNI